MDDLKFGSALVRESIWSRIRVTASGCWEWVGSKTVAGYGHMRLKGRRVYLHRYTYEAANGPIKATLQIDHLCRNRACCNPKHLEAVTQRVNILRGKGFPARHALVTSCPAGHAYTPANTYVSSRNQRICRACKAARERDRRKRAA